MEWEGASRRALASTVKTKRLIMFLYTYMFNNGKYRAAAVSGGVVFCDN